MHRGYGVRETNKESKTILDFLSAFHFTIANTCFKMQEHLIIYKSGVQCCQIDFLFITKLALHVLQSHNWRELDYLAHALGYRCMD